MPVFWTMFWLGFIGIPLLVLIASLISGKDGGYQKDTSHIWVYKLSGSKVKDASVRDVWEHNHPGQSWAQHQESQFIGCSIFLGIAFVVFLAWLAAEIFVLPQDRMALRLFWQIGAPILGALSAGAFYGIQTQMANYKSGFLQVLHIVALVVMGVGVVGALVLSFLGRVLPISHNWIWAPAAATGLLLILDASLGGAKKKQASKGGDKIERWVMELMQMTGDWDMDKLDAIMVLATLQLQKGDYDWQARDEDFFKLTESVLLDLVQGKPMSIQNQDIYRARDQVIKTLQAFYFYSVEKFPEYSLHPRIKKVMTKE
jgi:hypothetical protein